MSIAPPTSRFASNGDSTDCRATLHGGSRTFFAASLFLPIRIKDSATALYAFCRTADDAIDCGQDRSAAMEELNARLDAIYAGKPHDCAADRAFADCVARHSIPKRLPRALLEGFAWDAEGRRYATLSELKGYAVRVAGTVGVMMAWVMGVRDQKALARACDLGVAMQLTNIARDVGEDARAGRLYLPRKWLVDAGIDPDRFLAEPAFDQRLGSVVRKLLRIADVLYARGETGIARLPAACRPAIFAASLLYAEIGNEVRRRGYDSVESRAVVSADRKMRVLAAAALRLPLRGRGAASPPALPEADFMLRFLPAAENDGPGKQPRGVADRVVWMIDLFERLERADRASAEHH